MVLYIIYFKNIPLNILLLYDILLSAIHSADVFRVFYILVRRSWMLDKWHFYVLGWSMSL